MTEEQEEFQCGQPCPVENPCDECQEYWDRMREQKYWKDGFGWTDKAIKEFIRKWS